MHLPRCHSNYTLTWQESKVHRCINLKAERKLPSCLLILIFPLFSLCFLMAFNYFTWSCTINIMFCMFRMIDRHFLSFICRCIFFFILLCHSLIVEFWMFRILTTKMWSTVMRNWKAYCWASPRLNLRSSPLWSNCIFQKDPSEVMDEICTNHFKLCSSSKWWNCRYLIILQYGMCLDFVLNYNFIRTTRRWKKNSN